jgi:hypothetical protein
MMLGICSKQQNFAGMMLGICSKQKTLQEWCLEYVQSNKTVHVVLIWQNNDILVSDWPIKKSTMKLLFRVWNVLFKQISYFVIITKVDK